MPAQIIEGTDRVELKNAELWEHVQQRLQGASQFLDPCRLADGKLRVAKSLRHEAFVEGVECGSRQAVQRRSTHERAQLPLQALLGGRELGESQRIVDRI